MRFLLVISFLVCVAGACGKSGTDPEDSQTHWLAECTSRPDCGSSLECICGRCTKPCESGACEVPGRTVQCRAADSDASKALCPTGGLRAVCLEPCQTSANCGSGTACVSGSCLPVAETGSGGAAAGGTPGAGGASSNTGGSTQGGGSGGAEATTGGDGSAGLATGGSSSGGAGQSEGGAATAGAGGVACDCLRATVTVCGADGKNYDAACGDACVPVQIACRGQCPCAVQCAADSASCANGETCCTGLTCCAGVPVPAGQEYCAATCPRSDRALKRGFESVDPNQVLERLAELPISRWSYKTEGTETLHLGPMAQDFKQAFGLGESDRTILQVDADGVAFAAIQALYLRLLAAEAKNQALESELNNLKPVCGSSDSQRARR